MAKGIRDLNAEQLTSLLERIESLQEEMSSLRADIREIFKEAKGVGFDTKCIRQLLKMRATDADELAENEMLLSEYRKLIGL